MKHIHFFWVLFDEVGMKLITCASYYGTGSSAITNLIDECDNVHDMGDYEFRFVQDPDGICDLEYNLVLNNHRHNSGYAIKRYEKNVKYLSGGRFIKKYNRFFGATWKRLSNEYIKKLIAVEYKGTWHQELRDRGKLKYFIERFVNKIAHILFRVNNERAITLFNKSNTNYATYPRDMFYTATREYIDALFSIANTDNKEFVMADQLVPPTNTKHYLKFFNDLKVVCVDRDPRDLFLLEKEVWHGTVVPQNVDEFCIWYSTTRAHRQYEQDDESRIMRIRFEDMIFNYEDMVANILNFVGIDEQHHIKAKTYFNPEVSIKNTQLYKRMDKHAKDISIIEDRLHDYLYPFPV